ncbi:porin [Vibrio genomosp. F10]|uniref:Porin domain-containing protein n=1 Tax=Vibrio genomosp. F10 TaxID=723171 RepID=A0A1B9QRZ4_9VIBR|nr:porin [Vibrio genomosp. F10]OCH68609.1 hypothetical protein A6E14_16490 [Vibrio genomosp. F10]
MKKTLLALAIAASATSVQAIELYNQDGVTVDLKGDIEVRYKKSTTKDSEAKQEIDDADFGFDTRYAVNEDFQVGGYLEFSGDNSDRANDKTSVGNVYVGFYTTEFGSLKIGKLDTQMDDAGVGSDYLFGVSSFVDDAPFGGEEAVRYDYDNGSLYAGFGLIQDKHNAKAIGEKGSYFDLKLGYRVADFDFTGFYADAELRGTKTENNVTSPVYADAALFGLEARFAGIENVNLELGYYTNEVKEGVAKTTSSDEDTIALAADYTFAKYTFAGGYSVTSANIDGEEDQDNWFLNVGYALAPNTTAYAEVGGKSETGKDYDTGYGVGIKASF